MFITDTIHVLYPTDIYVTPDTVIGWAFDRMIDDAIRDYVTRAQDEATLAYVTGRNALPDFHDIPSGAGHPVWEAIVATLERPTLEEAKFLLTDAGICTFARETPPLRYGVMVNRMSDVLRPLGRACFPKEQHRTRGGAEAQMRSIVRRDLAKDTSRIHVYKCPCCTHPETGMAAWHVGHGRV